MGCIWIYKERPKVDWSKYLGPGWKADYSVDKVGTVIVNHASSCDSMIVCMEQLPSVICKMEVKHTWGLGGLAVAG